MKIKFKAFEVDSVKGWGSLQLDEAGNQIQVEYPGGVFEYDVQPVGRAYYCPDEDMVYVMYE